MSTDSIVVVARSGHTTGFGCRLPCSAQRQQGCGCSGQRKCARCKWHAGRGRYIAGVETGGVTRSRAALRRHSKPGRSDRDYCFAYDSFPVRRQRSRPSSEKPGPADSPST